MEVVRVKKYDEVYDKIDCDPGTAMEIADRFTFEVPGAKFMPAVRNKIWDGKIRVFNPMNCLLYCGLRSELERFCRPRDYSVEYDGIDADEELSLVEAAAAIKKMDLTLEPRDYQVSAFVHAVRKRRAMLLSPTASGKSLIIYMLTRYYDARTLVIVPTTSLVSQLASDFASYGLDSDSMVHRIYSGQDKHTAKPITVSTWQSLYKLPREYFQQFDVVIGDEAHLFKAKSLTAIMTKATNARYRFGFTGTLDGTLTNRTVLEGLFGPVMKVTTTAELMEKDHVAQLKIKAIVLKHSDESKKLVSKMDYQAEMDFLVRSIPRNKFIMNLALSLEGNTLLLFQYVDKHGKVLYDAIKSKAGDRPVYFVSGSVSGDEREDIRAIIEKETNAVLVASYGTTSTGVNIRNLHNVVFASPSKSRIRNLQSIGRGLRKSDDGRATTLYDLSDDLSWKSKKNYTMLHFVERIKTYSEENFEWKVYTIELK